MAETREGDYLIEALRCAVPRGLRLLIAEGPMRDYCWQEVFLFYVLWLLGIWTLRVLRVELSGVSPWLI